jgi:hypothetical protein
MSEELIEEIVEPSYIIFVSRKSGKNTIVDYVPYRNVTNHSVFIKLRVSEEQLALIENWGSDEIDLELLIGDFSEPDQVKFLSDEKNDETKDVIKYGDAIRKYLIIKEPENDEIL